MSRDSRSGGGQTTAAETSPAEVARMPFRGDIEGLRAIAVGLVVLLHAGVTWLSGGFIGVDVFFVISGFLITSLLIAEASGEGSVSISLFYARRARRILPAACATIAITVFVAYIALGPLTGKSVATDGIWATFFLENIHLIRIGADYFASGSAPSPLQHFWSLAVEEQFYLFWPAAVYGLVRIGRATGRTTAVVRFGVVAIVAVSFAWSVRSSPIHPDAAYFSPLTRAWELGAGALIATLSISIARIPGLVRALATWLGLALIAVASVALSSKTVFPGYAAALPVVGAVFVIAGGIGQPRGSAGSMLATAPMRFLGRISFGLYLWHWPVFVIATQRLGHELTWAQRVVCGVASLALALASYLVIERPLRRATWLRVSPGTSNGAAARLPLLLGGFVLLLAFTASSLTINRSNVAISVAAAKVVAVPSLAGALDRQIATPVVKALDGSATPTTQSPKTALDRIPVADYQRQIAAAVLVGANLQSVPAGVDPPVLQIAKARDPKYWRCLQGFDDTHLEPCLYGDRSATRSVVVIGDSHAAEWLPGLDTAARNLRVQLIALTKAACPPVLMDVPLRRSAQSPPEAYPQCSQWRLEALAWIKANRATIDQVVVSFSNYAGPTAPYGIEVPAWRAATTSFLRDLTGAGVKVTELGGTPVLPSDPGACLSRPNAQPQSCAAPAATAQMRRDQDQPAAIAGGARYIDVEPWFCTTTSCPVVIDNRIAYYDATHVSAQYAQDLWPILLTVLDGHG